MKRPAPPADPAGSHPIAVVAERTGLSQDVLRVWERRYGAVEPTRGPGGQRVYTDADVERLRLLHAVTRAGRAIGQVAALETEELRRLADEDAAARRERDAIAGPVAPAASLVEECLALAKELDADRLRAALRRGAAMLGASAFLDALAAPLMRRIGDDWFAGLVSPAQEHLASAAVHDVVAETLRGFVAHRDAPRVVVATPLGERHAIGALLAAAAASLEGWGTVYLGADLPAADIAAAAAARAVRLVALSVIHVPQRDRVIAELTGLRRLLPPAMPLWVGGSGAVPLHRDLGVGITVCDDLAEFRNALRALGASGAARAPGPLSPPDDPAKARD